MRRQGRRSRCARSDVPPWREECEARKRWAREVFSRLGFGLARDVSGFYRPARRPDPILPARRGRKRGRVREICGQLSLDLKEVSK
jgi:hypothetical protein